MSGILNFLADYYILFIIISVILLFALIGFIAGERKKNKTDDKNANATDLPINTSDSHQVNIEAPKMPVAPEPPVMMQNNVESTPTIQNEMGNQTLVINEPTGVSSSAQETSVTLPTGAPAAEVAPSLVIDEPAEAVSPVQESNVVLPTGVPTAEVAPSLVIDEPASAVVSTPETNVVLPTGAPTAEVAPSLVIDEPASAVTSIPETNVVLPTGAPAAEVAPSLVIDEPAEAVTPVQEISVSLPTEVPTAEVAPSLVIDDKVETVSPVQEASVVVPTAVTNNDAVTQIGNTAVETQPVIPTPVEVPVVAPQNEVISGTSSIFESEINNQNN